MLPTNNESENKKLYSCVINRYHKAEKILAQIGWFWWNLPLVERKGLVA